MLAAAWATAIATGLLALFAIVTAVFAIKAFGKQSEEVSAIQKQVQDQEALTVQQAELLKIQSDQLELQRQQLGEQRTINARQTEVLELQARELSGSLDERKREMEGRRRAQAARVFMWEERLSHIDKGDGASAPSSMIIAHVRNASQWPIYDVRVSFHKGSAPSGLPPALIPALMPGEEKNTARALPTDLPDYVDPAVFGAVIFFRDTDGIMWRARPDGVLDEIAPGMGPP